MKQIFRNLVLVVFAVSLSTITLVQCLDNLEIDNSIKNYTSNITFSNSIINSKKGVYSWVIEDLINDTLTFSNICNDLGLNEIFQEIPDEYLGDDLAKAISKLKDSTNNIEISYLCGDASWYKDSNYTKESIDKILYYNKNYGFENPINKIVFDIEPWTLGEDNWSEEFLKTIKDTYIYAKENDITFLLTIPFWLDTSENINDNTLYEKIIENSDGVIVMNYNRYACFEAIDNEVSYAKNNEKIIYSAAEIQEPNTKYGVEDSITYYNVGLNKLNEDWKYLKEKYEYSNLGFIYHDFNSLKILYNS